MSVETAEKAIKFFVRQIKESGLDIEENKPVLIFYGREPLVNFNVLEYVARRIIELRSEEKCLRNIEMSMVTNHLLMIRLLKLGSMNFYQCSLMILLSLLTALKVTKIWLPLYQSSNPILTIISGRQ